MNEVIPISEKNKYNFLKHNEFDLEKILKIKIHLNLIKQGVI
jgi:hypothetical protein